MTKINLLIVLWVNIEGYLRLNQWVYMGMTILSELKYDFSVIGHIIVTWKSC